jgi:hypothetical protein
LSKTFLVPPLLYRKTASNGCKDHRLLARMCLVVLSQMLTGTSPARGMRKEAILAVLALSSPRQTRTRGIQKGRLKVCRAPSRDRSGFESLIEKGKTLAILTFGRPGNPPPEACRYPRTAEVFRGTRAVRRGSVPRRVTPGAGLGAVVTLTPSWVQSRS